MWFINLLKGMIMGIANVIPGVSGGTLALITGIYEKIVWWRTSASGRNYLIHFDFVGETFWNTHEHFM